MSKRERWLVDMNGNIKVLDVVQFAGLDVAAPQYVSHGGKEYRYAETNDGVEMYEEIAWPPLTEEE